MKFHTSNAVEIAASLEPVLSQHGFHVGIGGSLAYRGDSEKDIDIIIYPHSRDVVMDLPFIISLLSSAGYWQRTDKKDSTVVPDVWVTTNVKRQNVDFFFMSRVDRPETNTLPEGGSA